MSKGPTAQGARTRETITRTAADLASVEGLDGLTIRRLAEALPMSVSGLYGHFGSKEALQLATIESARRVYVQEVITPALATTLGIERLLALCDSFISYVEREVFPGGCFFAAAMAEFDCKPGPVRDRIAELQTAWLNTLQRAAAEAIQANELRPDTDAQDIAFDLEAVLLSANWYVHLLTDTSYLDRARRSVRRRIAADTTGSPQSVPAQ
jgi:AcrR family transcriptional regulator